MSTVLAETASLVIACPQCGDVPTGARTEKGRRIAASHHARLAHKTASIIDLTAGPTQTILARSASLRISVAAATARIGMWQACPAMDAARTADQVLEEVRRLLVEAVSP